MPDVFFIHSNNPETIDHVLAEVQKGLLDLLPGSNVDKKDGPSWSLITARNPFLPYAGSNDPEGTAVVIGSTYDLKTCARLLQTPKL